MCFQLLPSVVIRRVFKACGVKRRRPPLITPYELVQALIFHAVALATNRRFWVEMMLRELPTLTLMERILPD